MIIMKNKALNKDFYMEIKKSMGRFLSIFFIVALGVSLFSGIQVSQKDMILSGDAYTDESNLMDIKIMSSYGLTQEDVDAINNLPDIENSVGSYSTDVLCEANGNMKVIHVMSYIDNMNTVTVSEGRLPQNENECLVDEDFLKSSGYKIGDTISFESGTSDDLKDTLNVSEYKIVGCGNSPLYFSFDRGSSTIGKGTVEGFAIVKPEAFSMSVYSEVYACVKGAKEALSFTQQYDSIVEDAIEQVKLIQNTRCEIRKQQLVDEAQSLISNAENELNQKENEANSQISENEKTLSDSEWEIKLGKSSIENAKTQLESAKKQLEAGEKELAEYQELYNQAIATLQNQKTTIEEQLQNIEKEFEKLPPEQQETAKQAMQELRTKINELDKEISSVTNTFEEKLYQSQQEIIKNQNEIATQEQKIKQAEQELNIGSSEIETGKTEIENAKNELDKQIQEGKDKIEESKNDVDDIELPVWYVFDRSSIPDYTSYGDSADRIAALAMVFPTIFFLVAALISLTTMTRMVEEQRIQIGTLKALGYSKFSIMKKYLNYALIATVGGSILGVLVGEKLFPYVIIISYKIMYMHIPHIIIPYQWGYAIIATLIAVLCTVTATVVSCYKELISQPATLMRPEAPKVGKRIFLEKIPFLWKKFNFSWKSSLRNLIRYKKRFFMTLFGIGGCMGLLLVGYGLRDSISDVARKQFLELQTYELSVFIEDNVDDKTINSFEEEIEKNNDIDMFTSVHMSNITAKNGETDISAYLTVIEDKEKMDNFFNFRNRVTKEKYELKDDGVIISEKTAKVLGVKKGDEITLSLSGKEDCKVKISNVCENYIGHYIYISEDYYESIFNEKPYLNNFLIKTDLKDKELEEIVESILKHEYILNVQYQQSLIEQLDNMLTALDSVIIILIIVAGMLSFVVLYNLNNININERRRELASLKVLGFYNTEIAHYVYRENILLTIFGILLGCGIGKILHYFTISTVEVDSAMFGRDISLSSFIIAILFTFAFSAFVNWIMYFKLKSINMVESLKSVE